MYRKWIVYYYVPIIVVEIEMNCVLLHCCCTHRIGNSNRKRIVCLFESSYRSNMLSLSLFVPSSHCIIFIILLAILLSSLTFCRRISVNGIRILIHRHIRHPTYQQAPVMIIRCRYYYRFLCPLIIHHCWC